MADLTPQQAKLLRWIADNRITGAEWRRDGKAAFGPPRLWNQHRLSSADSQITVDIETQEACRKYVEVGPVSGSMFVLNEAGRAALTTEPRS